MCAGLANQVLKRNKVEVQQRLILILKRLVSVLIWRIKSIQIIRVLIKKTCMQQSRTSESFHLGRALYTGKSLVKGRNAFCEALTIKKLLAKCLLIIQIAVEMFSK